MIGNIRRALTIRRHGAQANAVVAGNQGPRRLGAALIAEGLFGAVTKAAIQGAGRTRSGLGGAAFGLFGLVVGGGVLVLALMQFGPRSGGAETGGEVVGVHESRVSTDDAGTRRTRYSPEVAYSVDGQTYEVTGTGLSDTPPQVGTKRTVVYDPEDPASARLAETTTAWVAIIIAMGLATLGGLVWLVGGLVVAIIGWRVWAAAPHDPAAPGQASDGLAAEVRSLLDDPQALVGTAPQVTGRPVGRSTPTG